MLRLKVKSTTTEYEVSKIYLRPIMNLSTAFCEYVYGR
nr:MAG TPA: hypothetical protein [Caudoviricetes sp.]